MRQKIMIMVIVLCPMLFSTYRAYTLRNNYSFLELICFMIYNYILMLYIDKYTR